MTKEAGGFELYALDLETSTCRTQLYAGLTRRPSSCPRSGISSKAMVCQCISTPAGSRPRDLPAPGEAIGAATRSGSVARPACKLEPEASTTAQARTQRYANESRRKACWCAARHLGKADRRRGAELKFDAGLDGRARDAVSPSPVLRCGSDSSPLGGGWVRANRRRRRDGCLCASRSSLWAASAALSG